MNGGDAKSVSLDVVDLPLDSAAAWRHVSSPSSDLHAFGPHDPGPGNAELEWMLGLEQDGELVAVMWLRRAADGGWPSLGVASASIPPDDSHALVRLLETGLNRAAEGSTGHITVRLPLERSTTLELLKHLGFTMRSLLVLGGMAEVEFDLSERNHPD